MRLNVSSPSDPLRMTEQTFQRIEAAHSRVMTRVAGELKTAWRGQISSAGLGTRLPRTVAAQAYPKGEPSMNAAALVYVKRSAAQIVAGHDEGSLIRSDSGFYLAIPLPAAGRGRRGKRLTPGEWEQRHGMRLTYVYRRNRPALLVAQDARITSGGRALRKRGRRRKRDGILTGAQTVPIFVLVPQVKLRKRTDLIGAADAVSSRIPRLLSAEDID